MSTSSSALPSALSSPLHLPFTPTRNSTAHSVCLILRLNARSAWWDCVIHRHHHPGSLLWTIIVLLHSVTERASPRWKHRPVDSYSRLCLSFTLSRLSFPGAALCRSLPLHASSSSQSTHHSFLIASFLSERPSLIALTTSIILWSDGTATPAPEQTSSHTAYYRSTLCTTNS